MNLIKKLLPTAAQTHQTPHGLYAIRDKVAGQIIGGIWLHRNDAAAIRMFTDVAQDQQSMIHRHTTDFELVKLGELNNDTSVDGLREPQLILDGSTLNAIQDTHA